MIAYVKTHFYEKFASQREVFCHAQKLNTGTLTSCPICAVNIGECTGKEPEPVKPEPPEEQTPELEPEPEPVKHSGTNPAVVIVLALAAAGSGAVYYLKFWTPKQDAKDPVDLEDYDYGFKDEPEDGEESPDGESEEAGDEKT